MRLGEPTAGEEAGLRSQTGVGPLHVILDWLHRGYPEGVPPQDDCVPLFALLRRRLIDQEDEWVVDEPIDGGPTRVAHRRLRA